MKMEWISVRPKGSDTKRDIPYLNPDTQYLIQIQIQILKVGYSIGKSPFLTIELSTASGFDNVTLKPNIGNHPTLKSVHIGPSDGFPGWFW
jgi:hypothetical protein